MAIEAYSGIAPVAGSTVTVYDAGTLDLVTIFADPLDTPLANPFTADERTGVYTFYAETGDYDITLNSADPPSISEPALPVIIFTGTTPTRTASIVVDDPVTDEQILIAQVMY